MNDTIQLKVSELTDVLKTMDDTRARAALIAMFGNIVRQQVPDFNGMEFVRACGVGTLEKDGRTFLLIQGKEVPVKR